MAKQANIKHYRQTGTAKAPSSLPFGELAVAKDGTLFVGNASNAAIEAGVQVYTHAYDAAAKRHNFTGSGGANGRAKITAAVNVGDTFAVNGAAVAAYIGGDEADELPVGRWVSFVFDGTQLNFKSGGSIKLKVIAVASVEKLPASAKEGTIAVITQTAIGNVTASCVAEPSAPKVGDVFVLLSTRAVVPIAMGNTTIYPRIVKQYVNNAWNPLNARTYHKGEWLSMGLSLYKEGNENNGATGGWVPTSLQSDPTKFDFVTNDAGARSQTKRPGSMYVRGYGPRNILASASFATAAKIDLTNYSTLTVRFCYATIGDIRLCINAAKPMPMYTSTASVQYKNTTEGTIDVAGLSGAYYICIGALAYTEDTPSMGSWCDVAEITLT